MSTVASRRAQRRKTAAEVKARRQKIFVVVGFAVLGLLLFIQGPKLLDAFGGADAPVAAPAPVQVPEKTEVEARAYQSLPKKAGPDPFFVRSLANADPQAATVVSQPSGTRDPFAKNAPAAPPEVAAPAPEPVRLPDRIVVGTPTGPNAVARRGWIVVLASVQTRVGRAYAVRFAANARTREVGAVSVLNSSNSSTLRSGYYVVYTGPYETLSAVQRGASRARAAGYRTAYVREIIRY